MKIVKLIILILIISSRWVYSQGIDEEAIAEAAMRTVIENENARRLPVVGGGVGIFNFYGEVKNKNLPLMSGIPGYKFNIATFVGENHFSRVNFFVILGSLAGENKSITDSIQNLNFKSDITTFGVNFHYDFKKYIKGSPVLPFVSIGGELVQFSSKTDLRNASLNQSYHYWTDGTIRNKSEKQKDHQLATIIPRDNVFETDLRKEYTKETGNSYSTNAFAIPIELGIDYKITERTNLRLGYSLHYAFTDYIDNIASDSKSLKGDALSDMFSFTYITLHWDLFSEDRYIIQDNYLADIEGSIDFDLFADEDYDNVKDMLDKCPSTPEGVEVDSTGCPLDIDLDGVPNYLDKENNSIANAMVDENGVTIDKDELARKLLIDGIKRKDVEAYLQLLRAQSRIGGLRPSKPIPAKFKGVDTDGDGYISFDELLKAMNDFFDFSTDFSTKDIYELQDFFFEQ